MTTVTSPDRLRRLDALFAERVSGCKVKNGCCACELKKHGIWNEGSMERFGDLPHYTRSLDAAWEGVRPALTPKYWLTGPAHFYLWFEGMSLESGESKASFGSPCGRFNVEAKAMHPAEALVLACLSAVGVTEEELK